jgi:hypothetical protein
MKYYIGVTDDIWFHFLASYLLEGITMNRNGSPEHPHSKPIMIAPIS